MQSYPLKPHYCVSSCGSSHLLFRACSQVFTTRLVNLSSCLIHIAVNLLLVSLSLITRSHCLFISPSMCLRPWIALSHLSTQMRYVDSKRSICRRWDSPWCITLLFSWLASRFSAFISGCAFKHLQPRIILSLMTGHQMLGCGQILPFLGCPLSTRFPCVCISGSSARRISCLYMVMCTCFPINGALPP